MPVAGGIGADAVGEAELQRELARCRRRRCRRRPCLMNSSRCIRPVQPRPGRMSSVSSMPPRFGVSADFFHGIGLRHIGRPSMTACPPPPPGPKRITSYFVAQIRLLRDVLRADVLVRNPVEVERLPPPALGLRALPRVHQRDARGARRVRLHGRRRRRARTPAGRLPSSAASRSACDTSRTMNDPRANFWPAASNGSSASLDVRRLAACSAA